MKLTSPFYTVYAEILTEILSHLASDTLSSAQLDTLIQNQAEKIIPLTIPALLADAPFSSSDRNLPPHLEHLKDIWTHTILNDIRLSLLVPPDILSKIHIPHGLTLPFDPNEFDIFRPPGGDPFTDKTYRRIMQTLCDARQNRQIVRLVYVQDTLQTLADSEHRVTGSFLPLSIDYDPVTDRFHSLVQKIDSGTPISTFSLGIARIIDARFPAKATSASSPPTTPPPLFDDYFLVPPPDPLLLEIPDNRTLLEHCRHILATIDHYIQYDKPSHAHICRLSYKSQEEDILITLLTDLDPSIRILSPPRIARQVRTNRLRRQELAQRLMIPSFPIQTS